MRAWVIVVTAALCVPATSHAKGDPSATAIAAVIEEQFAGFRDGKHASTTYTKDAMIAMTGGAASPQVSKLTHADGKWSVFGPATIGKHKVRDLRVVVARDGKSAWASFVAKVTVDGLSKSGAVDLRASELFVKSTSGWQVRAAAWSIGVASAVLAKAAKADKLANLESVFDQNLGERDVIAAVSSLVSDGLDATAAARSDLVGIGSAPGEVTLGGKKLAAKLARDWVGKASLDGAVWAITAASGTTACATVNVELARGAATVPARLFAVFDKDAAGAWSPVLVHLAVAPPA